MAPLMNNNNIKQTNIRMPENLLKSLKRKAAEENKSLAQLMRELGKLYVSGGIKIKDKDVKADPIWKLAEAGVSLGESNISKNIDSILYRNEK